MSAFLDQMPAFQGQAVLRTLEPGDAYIERWAPGSRARARVTAMRAMGLAPTTSQAIVWVGTERVEQTEIRLQPVPKVVPVIEQADLCPRAPRVDRARAAQMRASVEHG